MTASRILATLALLLSGGSTFAFQVGPRSTPARPTTALSVASVSASENFQNSLQVALSFIRPVAEEEQWEEEWEWYPTPPETAPPAYLLKELSWFDKTVNKVEYGGEAQRSYQDSQLPQRFVSF